MMSPELFAKIRLSIPYDEMSNAEIMRLISVAKNAVSEADAPKRAKIVTAMGFDPETKWL